MKLSVRRKIFLSYVLIFTPFAILAFNLLTRDIVTSPTLAFLYTLILFSALFMSFFFTARFAKPLSQLLKYVEDSSSPTDEYSSIFDQVKQLNDQAKIFRSTIDSKQEELDAITANMQSGIIITDANGLITKTNDKAKQIFGNCENQNLSFLEKMNNIQAPSGEPIHPANSPLNSLLSGNKLLACQLKVKNEQTQKMFMLDINGSPLLDSEGKINGSIIIFLDITEQNFFNERLKDSVNFEKSKSNHLSVLHNVSLQLNKEKNIKAILKTVIKAAVYLSSAKNGFILQKEKDKFFVSSSFNFKAEDQNLTESDISRYLSTLFKRDAFRARKSIDINNFLDFFGEQDVKKLKAHIKSILVVPIEDKETKVVGLISLFNKESGKKFTIGDEKTTQILAAHTNVAISNAKKYEREHRIAQLFQKSLLPPKSFAKSITDKADINLAYKPASKEAMVGGDFYDIIHLDENRIACIIADVNGRGVEAAVITSQAKNTFKAFAYEGLSPDRILEKANKALYNQTPDEIFVTAVFGVLDLNSGIFEYSNAGHPVPLIYRYKKNRVLPLKEGSTPLGILPGESYDLNHINLELNDSLVLYTDGLIEGRYKGQFFGEKRLARSVLTNAPLSSNTAEKILEDLEDFTSNNLHDDIAVFVLKLKQMAPKQNIVEHVFFKH